VILRTQAEKLFADIRAITSDGAGVTRESYGPGVNATIEYLTRFALDAGLEVGFDRAANIVFSLPDTSAAPALWCGSHLDSLPQSGNYDGLAGVIAGLLCLVRLKREHVTLVRPFKVIGMRGEESAWFGKGYTGSSAMFGKLSTEDLALKSCGSGRSLAEALEACGADIVTIKAQKPVVRREDFAGYIELHIEQGPVMVDRGLSVAVVPAIRGGRRHMKILCIGESGHSGAVPRASRRDTVFAVADVIMRLDGHWFELSEKGRDLVVTCGVLGTDPNNHSPSRIPGETSFSLDVRSQNTKDLEEFYGLMLAECDAVAEQRGVDFVFDRLMQNEPAVMDKRWFSHLLDLSKRLGLPYEPIPSGSGHDAAIFTDVGIPSAMIFIRNYHGSHNPNEAMDTNDFIAGTELLYSAIQNLP
jgi:N-carbamoyl-L-amino-acid hydrolase